MTKTKKDKNKSALTGSLGEHNLAVDMEHGSWQAASPFAGTSGDGRKFPSGAEQKTDEEVDEHLLLTYLCYHRLLEQALVRAGFVMALSSNKQARPDWYRWARHIEKQFDPGSSDVTRQAVDYLLDLRDDMEALPGRRQNRFQWQSDSPYSDNLWLAEMIQQTGLQLTHRYKFVEAPGCDTPQVMAALFVVEAWLPLVPGGGEGDGHLSV